MKSGSILSFGVFISVCIGGLNAGNILGSGVRVELVSNTDIYQCHEDGKAATLVFVCRLFLSRSTSPQVTMNPTIMRTQVWKLKTRGLTGCAKKE